MGVGRVRYLLLDFDGPVCSVFAGFPAPDVARILREHLRGEVPGGWMEHTDDPHEILRASAELGSGVVAHADQELTRLEVEAVKTAEATPYTADLIDRAKAGGTKLAIISNNAQTAVAAYLADSGLVASIDYVSARSGPDPALMKPNPYLVRKAVSALNAERESSALVGDQVSDVIAAHRAGVRAVGYANKSSKVDSFKEASARSTRISRVDERHRLGPAGAVDERQERGAARRLLTLKGAVCKTVAFLCKGYPEGRK
jgi:beta-phosphoglucomutase-like phosphatase (HAD superfamily)